MPTLSTIGDPISCGDQTLQASVNVLADGKPVVLVGDLTAGHAPCFPPTQVITGASTVFVNGIPVAFVGSNIVPHTCGPVTHSGTVLPKYGTIMIENPSPVGLPSDILTNAALVDPAIKPGVSYFDAATKLSDDPDIDTSGYVALPLITGTPNAAQIAISKSIGVDPNAPPPKAIDHDDSNPPPVPPNTDDNCDDIYAMTSFPDTFLLSPNITLGMVSTQCVVSGYSVNAINTQSGLTKQQIVCNLRHLAINIIENFITLISPSYQLNSGFRIAVGTSQHYEGQAIDIQIPGASLDQYWTLAKLITTSLPFDQFILEYGGTNPWYHISFNMAGNRHVIRTRTQVGSYPLGLIRVR